MPPRSPLDERLLAATRTVRGHQAARLTAVHEMLDLAVRPGADARAIVLALAGLDYADTPPVLRETARAAITVITRMVPAPRNDGGAALWGIGQIWPRASGQVSPGAGGGASTGDKTG